MKANGSSNARQSSEPAVERPKERQTRGSYRRELTAPSSSAPDSSFGPQAKRSAAVVLEVLAGIRTTTEAAAALGIRVERYYLLEQRAVRGLISACEPRAPGRVVSADRRLAQLERELGTTRRDLMRQQALTRTTQRALGLLAAVQPPASKAGKAKEPEQAAPSKRRKHRAQARALRAARLLAAGEPPGENASPTVKPSPGSLAAAAMESAPTMEADHGGTSHAGRPKAVGNL